MKNKTRVWIQRMDEHICGVWIGKKPTKAQRAKAFNAALNQNEDVAEVIDWKTHLEKTWAQ